MVEIKVVSEVNGVEENITYLNPVSYGTRFEKDYNYFVAECIFFIKDTLGKETIFDTNNYEKLKVTRGEEEILSVGVKND